MTIPATNPDISQAAHAALQPLVAPAAFPLLARAAAAGPFAYLDSAASAQKPAVVLERLRRFYETGYANIHRGVYPLSEAATEDYEAARERAARFINAAPDEIVFTRGATEAINLVANSYGGKFLKSGDAILLTRLEHHANIVPWQMLRDRLGLHLRVAPVDAKGDIDLAAFRQELDHGVKLVAVTAIANTIGTVTPLAEMIRLAHLAGAKVLVDGAQAAPHRAIDVKALGCDFLVFTGHKVYGPDGIGVLFGKADLLESMPPWQGGGDMIRSVSFERTVYADSPRRFEAGTPPIGAAIGLAAALDFISGVGFERIAAHDRALADYAIQRLEEIPGLKIIGRPRDRAGIVSMALDGLHPHDVGSLLGAGGICVRTGHHCAQPLMDHLGLSGTIRASFAVHTGRDDIDLLAAELTKARQVLR